MKKHMQIQDVSTFGGNFDHPPVVFASSRWMNRQAFAEWVENSCFSVAKTQWSLKRRGSTWKGVDFELAKPIAMNKTFDV